MRRAIAAALIVGLPVGWLVILFFGGGQVRNCLGLFGCGLPPPDTSGPLDEPAEVLRLSVAFAAAWFAVLAVSIRYLWSVDGRRVRRAATVVGGVIIGTAIVTLVVRLGGDAGKRVAAEDGGLYALIVAAVVVPLAVMWLLATTHHQTQRP